MSAIKVESFLNHTPGTEDIKRMCAVREDAIRLFQLAESIVPECAEKTLGLRKLEEAVMWLNKGIILNPLHPDEVKTDYTPIGGSLGVPPEPLKP